MRKWLLYAGMVITLFVSGCNDNGNINTTTIIDANFQTGVDGWTPGFSEFSTDTDSATLQTAAGVARLPKGLDTTQYAMRMQAQNGSDDMFMFLKKKVSGFVPNQTYNINIELTLGTQYPAASMGTGGSPGSSVYLKAGASPIEPVVKLDKGFYHFSLDKGQQSQAGKDAVLLGDVANGEEDFVYRLVQRSNAGKPISVKANAAGEIWFFVGTDSGFEGLSIFYYDRIRITATEQLQD
ncbi:hypothetical protein [Dyadobacter sandarakinus]|uniref:Lipoprotein n=1 Tax=Dyadobacter sandarakinus TaxID=2747268 RepID=A0ABX7I7E1_9BACT|nr:hypothetical protein [Dyadobacter sandarakinus]QRR01705.1 hypothetical protein HWI92_12690 [Dyadobacter sandarakinus]